MEFTTGGRLPEVRKGLALAPVDASMDIRPKVIFLLWRVWHHRNNVVHVDGKASIIASARYISNYLQSFLSITKPNLPGQTMSEGPHVWAAPLEGRLKANVDAGWDELTKAAGIGIVIWDYLGHLVVSVWRFIQSCASAEEVEMMACLKGLKHLVDLRRWPATLESDCLRVIQMVSGKDHEMSSSWALVNEVRELLMIYQDIAIRKVDRMSNGVAHVLAQLGKADFSGVLHDSASECSGLDYKRYN
jgi:ribonuclease HI